MNLIAAAIIGFAIGLIVAQGIDWWNTRRKLNAFIRGFTPPDRSDVE